MGSFHRSPVLVPIDYSVPSLQAAKTARTVAADQDIMLVHVALDVDLVVPAHNWLSDVPPMTEEDHLKQLSEWSHDSQLGDVHLKVRHGDPGTEVCDVAEELGTQLIVVSSHGRHGLKRLLLGSVAERIIRHCDCSVLVLRRGEESSAETDLSGNFFPRKKVVVPIDFSESSVPTVETALQTADSPADVDVLNVVNELSDPKLIGSDVITADSRRTGRQDYLNSWLHENGFHDVQGHVVTGDPGIMTVDYADHVNADLIVMPSHGYHGLARLTLGSTTERVLRYARQPVLVLRRHDAE